jgi:hypothetical protein
MEPLPIQRPYFRIILVFVAVLSLAGILCTPGFVRAASSTTPTATAMQAKNKAVLTPTPEPTPIPPPVPISASTSGIIFFAIVIVIVVLVGAFLGMRKHRKRISS